MSGVTRRGRRAALMFAVVPMMVLGGASTASAAFDFQPGSLAADAFDPTGAPDARAGAHPQTSVTAFEFTTRTDQDGFTLPDGQFRDMHVDLPLGFVGNPQVAPQCTWRQLNQAIRCPADSQIGVVNLDWIAVLPPRGTGNLPLYNMVPTRGNVAEFGFATSLGVNSLVARLRPDDYGIRVSALDSPQGGPVFGAKVQVWGVPALPSHDPDRLRVCQIGMEDPANADTSCPKTYLPSGAASRAFATSPPVCTGTPARTSFRSRAWGAPDRWIAGSADASSPATGCDNVPFSPDFNAKPTTTAPDAPTGLDARLGFNQDGLTLATGTATAHLKDARVVLPEGMTINPASAGGLAACSDAQAAIGVEEPLSCPSASKIGTVTATTPVLAEPLSGGIYLRPQASSDPASGDMFRVVLDIKSDERGIDVKLPGRIAADPATGRLTTTFDNNPQLPVSELKLSFKAGPRAPLVTPRSCGAKTVTAGFTAWTGKVVDRVPTFSVDCAAGLGGFAPSAKLASSRPVGGAFTSLDLAIDKPDGNDDVTGVSLTLPTGLIGNLKGNLNTQVGTARAFAGPGSNPYVLPGKVLLEGPYGDAPFSLRVVVPAKAGPFDLGEVVVRQKIYVDPITAQVTVVSDPVPTIVKGVPVRLQRLEVNVDKPGFIVNPTNCSAKTVSATLSSAGGQSVPVTNRFQVGECMSLDLKPLLALSLSGKGQTTDGKHPAVSATLTQPQGGQANLKKVKVALPLSLALDPDNAESDSLCSFIEGSKPDPQCPASSVVGRATAVSPILNEPLTGPVYFTKNERKDPKSGRSIKTTPKLVIPLVGENGVRLTLTGTSTVVDDQLVTTFDEIPDARVSSFKLDIIGGKKGILVVSNADICKSTQIADQQITGQNNKTANTGIAIQTPSCPTKILSTTVGKTTVKLKIGGLGAGKVTVTGRGIRKTTKTIAKSTVATITAKRTGKTKPGAFKVKFAKAKAAAAR